MAEIKSLKERVKQRSLLIIALAVLIAALIVLYFGFGRNAIKVPQVGVSGAKPAEQKTNIVLEEKLKKITFDFSFLTQTILPFLKTHGEFPIEKGTTGRTNPFSPY
jgi:hypothetical protein